MKTKEDEMSKIEFKVMTEDLISMYIMKCEASRKLGRCYLDTETKCSTDCKSLELMNKMIKGV